VHTAKKDLTQKLKDAKIEYRKLTARTVSFEDLARASAIFVTIHGAKFPQGFTLQNFGVPKPSEGGYIIETMLCTWGI